MIINKYMLYIYLNNGKYYFPWIKYVYNIIFSKD